MALFFQRYVLFLRSRGVFVDALSFQFVLCCAVEIIKMKHFADDNNLTLIMFCQ